VGKYIYRKYIRTQNLCSSLSRMIQLSSLLQEGERLIRVSHPFLALLQLLSRDYILSRPCFDSLSERRSIKWKISLNTLHDHSVSNFRKTIQTSWKPWKKITGRSRKREELDRGLGSPEFVIGTRSLSVRPCPVSAQKEW